MAKSKAVRLTPEEALFIQQLRANEKVVDPVPTESRAAVVSEANKALADAFVSAIERTRPQQKKTLLDRTENTPWSPKDGEPRLKLKRKMYQHGLPVTKVTNKEIDLMNKIRPGVYCDGWVRVTLRKDRGLDIDYPIRTASQRLKLVNLYGVRGFSELLERVIDERANPTKYRKAEDADLYDFQE